MSFSFYCALYTITIVFLTTSAYSWVLKRFHVPLAYKENFGELFPARQTLATMYLLQFSEIPYLIYLDKPAALFYVNGTALLVFTSYLVLLVRGYFFLEFRTPRQMFLFMHPVALCWIVLMLPMFGIIEYTPIFHNIMTVVVVLVFMGYLYLLDKARRQIMHEVREIDEDEYSNESDFPVKFAMSMKWLPLIASLLLLMTFLINLYTAKMVRDIVFIIINTWFGIYTLNPHRNRKKLPQVLRKMEKEESVTQSKYRLTEKYCKEVESKLINVLKDKQLFLEEHLSMNDLIDIMHTNRNYLSEVIARSQYRSFYKLVNTLRIEHACEVLKNDPTMKLEQVAMASGFSSGSSFSQIFRRIMNVTPKEYITEIHAE